jgi:hypothetical protein
MTTLEMTTKKTRKFIATLPSGEVVTRSSKNEYKFVGAFSIDGGETWNFGGFSQTEKGATTLARSEMNFLKSEAKLRYRRGNFTRDQYLADLELANRYTFAVVIAEEVA